jgi:hypothetical protein
MTIVGMAWLSESLLVLLAPLALFSAALLSLRCRLGFEPPLRRESPRRGISEPL